MTETEKKNIVALSRDGYAAKDIASKLNLRVGSIRGVIAQETGKWAKTMTKWLIRKDLKKSPHWEIVSFEGAKGGEPIGIVDLIVIRKNFKKHSEYKQGALKKGDLLEMFLIQVKGGSASRPSPKHKERLLRVGKYYHAKKIILAKWGKGAAPKLSFLKNRRWKEEEARVIGVRSTLLTRHLKVW